MKVALVHDWLTGMRGGERCLEAMCEIYPQADIYTLLHFPGSVPGLIESRRINVSWLQRLPAVKKNYRYYLPFMPKAIESFHLKGYDLVISSSHCVSKGVRVQPGTPHFCYCYTPMRYIWDMYGQYFENNPHAGLAMNIFRNYLKKWDIASSLKVGRFCAISETVQKRIKRCYNKDSSVVYPPVGTERFSVSGQKGEFYLIVSAFAPYKRVDIAIEAFNSLGYPLKIIGSGQDEKKLKKIAVKNIEFLGWQPDEKVAGFYARCKALIFPGEEDFGIVPIEAMACGRPVIAFAAGGVTETVAAYDPAVKDRAPSGVFFNEQTPAALVRAVRQFELVESAFDPQAIRKHALTFDKNVFKNRFKEEITEFLKNA